MPYKKRCRPSTARPYRQYNAICLLGFLCLPILLVLISRALEAHSTFEPIDARGVYFGDPLPNLTLEELQEFELGSRLFNKRWESNEGLGPLFNSRSCVGCHRLPLPGGSGETADTFVIRSSKIRDVTGGSTFSRFLLIDGSQVLRNEPTSYVRRRSQALYGLGLLEAVPEETILEYADQSDRDHDEVSGRSVRTAGKIGRFGWKGTVPTLEGFVSMALAVEMGLSTPTFSNGNSGADVKPGASSEQIEVSDNDVRTISKFIRLLGAPPATTQAQNQDVSEGHLVFQSLRCDKCHRETFDCFISKSAYRFYPYTDLLVHDMGAGLSDGISEKGVTETEFRTPPLWGLWSTGPPFLHDGRAKNLREAIESHGGEARRGAEGFKLLSDKNKDHLIEFLKSL